MSSWLCCQILHVLNSEAITWLGCQRKVMNLHAHVGKNIYPLDRRIGWHKSRSEWCRKPKIPDHIATRTPNPRSSSPQLFPIPTELPPYGKLNSVAFSLQANYTDWAKATGWRILVPTFTDRGVSRGQRGGNPTVVNLSFLDQSPYFFFQVAPTLSARGLSGPSSRYTVTQKFFSARNRTRDLWVVKTYDCHLWNWENTRN
jgi:hypothetical protein